jgi:hypothetical protein
LEVKGTLTLKNSAGLIAEQKPFTIKSIDALAIIKNEAGHVIAPFHPYTINLVNPIKSLSELDGKETITAFANVDPVSAFDLLLNTGFAFGTAGITSILGIDEINILGWTFSVAEYSAMLTNAVLGSNSYSQNVEYFTNLREYWTQRDLALYINNKSAGFDFVQPVHPLADICIALPTSPPDLILG